MRKRKEQRGKYRSFLEKTVSDIFQSHGIEADHEVLTLPYLQPEKKRKYLVDFTLAKFPSIIVEVKGRFVSADRQKMLLIKEQYPDKQVIMLFGRSKNTLSKTSKTTYAEWCDKNNINWIDIIDFKKEPKSLLSMTSEMQT